MRGLTRLRQRARDVGESVDAWTLAALVMLCWRVANRRPLARWFVAHGLRGGLGRVAAMVGKRTAPVRSPPRRTRPDGRSAGGASKIRPGNEALHATGRSAGGALSSGDARAEPGAPPFDLRVWNPIRWRRTVGRRVVALGPVRRLPPGAAAQGEVRPWDLFGLRRAHHVKDVAAFHANLEARAATLARVAATGALIHLADGGDEIRGLLGEELCGLMERDPAGLGPHAREAHSIRMRRLALRGCRLGRQTRRRDEGSARPPRCPAAAPPGGGLGKPARDDAGNVAAPAREAAGAPAREADGNVGAAVACEDAALPLVSVLLATRRARFLPRAVAAVARQTYPRIELVLALHGDEFRDADLAAADLPRSAKTLRLPAQQPLGAVLDAATAASAGALIAKMDDDDAYGPNHVWDLVLAREYSGAQLVGKGLEFVYLSATDETVHLHPGIGEDYRTMTLAGGTLLISRQDLARAGGWPPLPRGVDKALVEGVLRARGCVYRAHGAEYVMIRREEGHTWTATDDYFMQKAATARPGWRPEFAGLPAEEPLPVLRSRERGPPSRGEP